MKNVYKMWKTFYRYDIIEVEVKGEKRVKSTKEIIIQGVIFSLIPAVCTLLASTDILFWIQDRQYLGKNVDVEMLKVFFSFLGIFLTFLLLTINIIKSQMREKKYHKQASDLIKYTKEIMVSAMADQLNINYCSINIRIFVPKKRIIFRLKRKIFNNSSSKLYFEIKNIDGLADAGMTNNLKFRVSPADDKQGLVGECYNSRKMIYDDNLKESNDKSYNLSEYQINKTNNLRFIIVCPTFNEDGEIDAIVAFDSINEIKVTKENEKQITNLILNYTQQLHEKVPELFKPKGGIV